MSPSRRFTDEQEKDVIAALYQNGDSARKIARDLGLPGKDSVIGALRRQGVSIRSHEETSRIYTINPHVFDSINNEESAYWWGYLWADGYTHRSSLVIGVKEEDREIAEKLNNFLESNAPIKNYERRLGGKIYPTSCVCFTDKHLVYELSLLGIVPKRESIIPILMYLPDSLANHWLRGYFDGDGSARKSKDICFCGSSKLLWWIRETASVNCGTNPKLSISKHASADIYYLYFGWKRPALAVADFMYRGATVWLKRKRDRINEWFK